MYKDKTRQEYQREYYSKKRQDEEWLEHRRKVARDSARKLKQARDDALIAKCADEIMCLSSMSEVVAYIKANFKIIKSKENKTNE